MKTRDCLHHRFLQTRRKTHCTEYKDYRSKLNEPSWMLKENSHIKSFKVTRVTRGPFGKWSKMLFHQNLKKNMSIPKIPRLSQTIWTRISHLSDAALLMQLPSWQEIITLPILTPPLYFLHCPLRIVWLLALWAARLLDVSSYHSHWIRALAQTKSKLQHVLNFASKVCEKIALKQFGAYLVSHNRFSSHQSGNKSLHSPQNLEYLHPRSHPRGNG